MEPIRTRTLEVTVISGENLYMDRNPVTENAYVVVRTESIKFWSTKVAKAGGGSLGYPLWNEKLLVEMPLHARSITFEVQCKTSKGMVRSIGLARIAVSDVLGEEGEDEVEGTLPKEGCLHVLSYRLRNWEGRRNGVLNFSMRVKKEADEKEEDKEDSMGSEKKDMMVSSGGFKHEVMGVQVDHHHEKDANNNNGVVLGIPVWWNHLGIHV